MLKLHFGKNDTAVFPNQAVHLQQRAPKVSIHVCGHWTITLKPGRENLVAKQQQNVSSLAKKGKAKQLNGKQKDLLLESPKNILFPFCVQPPLSSFVKRTVTWACVFACSQPSGLQVEAECVWFLEEVQMLFRCFSYTLKKMQGHPFDFC